MKFSTRQDLELPLETVFAELCNFETFERAAMRRGVDVVRTKEPVPAGEGSAWDVSFSFRGRARNASLEVVTCDVDDGLQIAADSDGLEATTEVDLVALSPNRTRILIGIEMLPKTIAARLMIQSMKLAKRTLDQRFKTRVGEFAATLENRHGVSRAS